MEAMQRETNKGAEGLIPDKTGIESHETDEGYQPDVQCKGTRSHGSVHGAHMS